MALAYCWQTPQRYPTADEAIDIQQASLTAWNQVDAILFMATSSMGWDPRPWQQPENPNPPWLHPDKMTRWKLTPADWTRLLWEIKSFMDNQPADSPARKMLLQDNWNEWGEDHYIVSQVTDEFGYMSAVRTVFTNAANQPDYQLPEELGLGHADKADRYDQRKRISNVINTSSVIVSRG